MLLSLSYAVVEKGSPFLKTFEQLHFQGKVLHFGVIKFFLIQIQILKDYLTIPIVANQIQSTSYRFVEFDHRCISGYNKS